MLHNAIKDILTRDPKMSIRNYQLETIAECVEKFTKENYRAILIESPTGSGKTVMGMVTAIMTARALGATKIGWSAMRRNLLTQAAEVAAKFGLDESNFVTISMFDKNPPKVDILVVDEAHHDATVSMATLHKKTAPIKVLGLSATPTRTDKAELIFEKSIARAGIYELVRQGYLARPDLYILPDWRVSTVCDAFLSDPKRWGKSLMFFFTMEECEAAKDRLSGGGIRAEVVHANCDREPILADFDEGKLDVLINMAILTEGFDCPQLETVFVRPTGNALTQQMGGRVLRLSGDLRKKIVQSKDSPTQFSKIAPVGRTFRRNDDGQLVALDYDSEVIARLIAESNKKIGDSLSLIPKEKHALLAFLSKDENKKGVRNSRRSGLGQTPA